MLLVQAQILLQLIQADQQLTKGWALVFIRVHASVSKLLHSSSKRAAVTHTPTR